jgi:hypothetical protein
VLKNFWSSRRAYRAHRRPRIAGIDPIASMFGICSHNAMTRFDPLDLAQVLTALPASRIAGLLAASPDWKERAAISLANDIVASLEAPPRPRKDQLTLRL